VPSPIGSSVVAGTGIAGPGAASLGRSPAAPDDPNSQVVASGTLDASTSAAPSAAPLTVVPSSPSAGAGPSGPRALVPTSLPSVTSEAGLSSLQQHTSTSGSTTQLPPGATPVSPIVNDHGMVTRGKHGFRQPRAIFDLHATVLSPIPKTYRSALADPNWRDAMLEELTALQANNTWDLVPPPRGTNIVTGKWVYRHKLHPDGTLDRYKARWVLRGFT
jgi:hypothetical protein